MSKLDNVYTLFRRYCKEHPLGIKGVHELKLYEDGSGNINEVRYAGTNDNPFKVDRTLVVVFSSPGDGARKLEKLLDEQNTVP